jgi:hypothetical protein
VGVPQPKPLIVYAAGAGYTLLAFAFFDVFVWVKYGSVPPPYFTHKIYQKIA